MTALVTGASGFLGQVLVRRLRERGDEELRLFHRPGSGSLTNPADCLRAVEGTALVYHLAAGTRGAPAERFADTVAASEHLIGAALVQPQPPRIVLVSSFAVYGTAGLPRGALVDETTPLEPHPERRDVYAQAKLRQERLFAESGLDVAVVRPGVLYGPGAVGLSARIGLLVPPGLFLHVGGANVLPLCHVESCAEALIRVARHRGSAGEAYNAVDDDLPTCAEYLHAYRREAGGPRALRLPYAAARALGAANERSHAWSGGRIPLVLTPYRAATLWGGNRFSNAKLKAIGWRPHADTAEGLRTTFAALRNSRPRDAGA